MPLASLIRYLAPAALLALASCTAQPRPDVQNVHGGVEIAVMQGFAYYPEPLIQELKEFNKELALEPSDSAVNAVAARIRWKIDDFDERCEVAIALRRQSHWVNYAWAGDGRLTKASRTWLAAVTGLATVPQSATLTTRGTRRRQVVGSM